jgi:hypothetical protein
MKRNAGQLRRTVFNIASAFSLPLFITVLVMWMTTRHLSYRWTFHWHGVHYAPVTNRGIGFDNLPELHDHVRIRDEKTLKLVKDFRNLPPTTPFDQRNSEKTHVISQLQVIKQQQSPARIRYIIPYWAAAAVLLICPSIWSARFLRQRSRLAENQCRACGYNLTGNTSGTCPECGTPVPSRPEGIA